MKEVNQMLNESSSYAVMEANGAYNRQAEFPRAGPAWRSHSCRKLFDASH